MKASAITAALLVCSTSGVAAQPAGELEEVRHPVVDSIAAALAPASVPGLAVLLIHEGRVLHRAGYGLASLRPARPVTLRTPFYIASTAKMLTAAAVLDLAEEREVRLEEPIGRYLTGLPPYARRVTVRQLLTHTSGLPDHYDLGGDDRAYDNADVLRLLAAADGLAFEPGSQASYSNSGYVLLARLVEAVSGRSFGHHLEQRFFRPLGMRDARVIEAAGDRPSNRAIGYRPVASGFERSDYRSTTTGSGGVYASLADLERWYRAMRAGEVLDAATLEEASRPPELTSDRRTPYGMGWLAEFAARGPLKDRWYVLAFGSLRGFRALFQWYQEDDLLLVWLANGASDAVLEAFHPLPGLILTGGG